MNRRSLSLSAGLLLMLIPAMARAEVSVQLDQQGRLKRVLYLTRGNGASAVVWGQVRARLPLDMMLNPLGDNLGDLPPAIATNPATGNPWVVWPQNVGNQKRLAFSAWDGKGWTAPVQIARPDLLGSDQVEPRLLFDKAGIPYLIFTEAASPARVMFMTLSHGVWTPALSLSEKLVDSRHPAAALQGSDLKLTFATPSGSVQQVVSTAVLMESATSLMDSPIPPGALPKPPDAGGSGSEPPADVMIKHH
jgi:hypothetical protein